MKIDSSESLTLLWMSVDTSNDNREFGRTKWVILVYEVAAFPGGSPIIVARLFPCSISAKITAALNVFNDVNTYTFPVKHNFLLILFFRIPLDCIKKGPLLI